MRNYILLALLLIFQNAATVFSQNQTDTAAVRAIFKLALQLEQRNLDSSLIFFKKGKSLAQQLGATAWLPEFEMQIGRSHANQDRPDSAIFYFKLAKTGFENLHDQRGVARVISKIRWVYNHRGEFEKAHQLALEALAIYEKLGDEAGTATAFGNLGDVLYSQGKYRESADYFQKAYDLNKKLNRPVELAVAAQGIGEALLQLREYEKSLDFQNEALELRRQHSDAIDIALSLNARGNILKYLKRYTAALADYQESLRLARQTGFAPLEQTCISNTGHVLSLLGRFREALPYLLQGRKLLDESKSNINGVESFRLLADAYAGIGQFDSAYFFKEKQLRLGDSLLNLDNQKNMSELQTRYETTQKEAKIEEQTAQLAREKQQFWAVVAGLILALAVGVLLFLLSQKLRQRNREKEFLIKEIHHRVKNNLQVLSSLLHLQSRQIQDEVALDAVREGQNRVEAMGLIHQKLYMGENLAAVEMPDFFKELGDTLLDSFGMDERVAVKLAVEPIRLDVDTAVPLGLIVNELLTNSLKYGFPDGRRGQVEIELRKEPSGKLFLKISDDGVGAAAVRDEKKSTGFGGNLVEMLSKKLKGKPEVVVSETGFSTSILFENFKMV